MNAKAFLFLSLLFGVFAIALLISSVVAADKSQVDGEKEINQQDRSKDSKRQVDEAKEPNQYWGCGKRCRWQCGCCPGSTKGYGCRQCCHYVADATAVESHNGGARGSGKRGSGGRWGGGRKGGDDYHHGGGKGGDSGSHQGGGDHKGGGGG